MENVKDLREREIMLDHLGIRKNSKEAAFLRFLSIWDQLIVFVVYIN